MEPVRDILLPSAAATSAMTVFSYVVSDEEHENYKEPELLGGFLERTLNVSKDVSLPGGWAAHYIIGAAFAGGYELALQTGKQRPSLKNGLLFGVLAGAAGILSWNGMFEKHPNPPKTHKKGFFAQLLLAHVIFGITLSACKKQ